MILLLVAALSCWVFAAFHIAFPFPPGVDWWIFGWCWVLAYAIAQGWPWQVWPSRPVRKQ